MQQEQPPSEKENNDEVDEEDDNNHLSEMIQQALEKKVQAEEEEDEKPPEPEPPPSGKADKGKVEGNFSPINKMASVDNVKAEKEKEEYRKEQPPSEKEDKDDVKKDDSDDPLLKQKKQPPLEGDNHDNDDDDEEDNEEDNEEDHRPNGDNAKDDEDDDDDDVRRVVVSDLACSEEEEQRQPEDGAPGIGESETTALLSDESESESKSCAKMTMDEDNNSKEEEEEAHNQAIDRGMMEESDEDIFDDDSDDDQEEDDDDQEEDEEVDDIPVDDGPAAKKRQGLTSLDKNTLGEIIDRALETPNYFREGSVMKNLIESGVEVVWFSDRHPNDVVYAICCNREYKHVSVVFRGTVNFHNWLMTLTFSMTDQENPIKEHYEGKEKFFGLHKGFSLYMTSKRKDDSLTKIQEIFQKVNKIGREVAPNGDYKLSVTGHSLGGALATILGFFAATSEKLAKVKAQPPSEKEDKGGVEADNDNEIFSTLLKKASVEEVKVGQEEEEMPMEQLKQGEDEKQKGQEQPPSEKEGRDGVGEDNDDDFLLQMVTTIRRKGNWSPQCDSCC